MRRGWTTLRRRAKKKEAKTERRSAVAADAKGTTQKDAGSGKLIKQFKRNGVCPMDEMSVSQHIGTETHESETAAQ